MKLPQSVGQKKTKAIEQMLGEIDVELAPIPTEVRHSMRHSFSISRTPRIT